MDAGTETAQSSKSTLDVVIGTNERTEAAVARPLCGGEKVSGNAMRMFSFSTQKCVDVRTESNVENGREHIIMYLFCVEEKII